MVGMIEGILAKNWRRLAVNPFFFFFGCAEQLHRKTFYLI